MEQGSIIHQSGLWKNERWCRGTWSIGRRTPSIARERVLCIYWSGPKAFQTIFERLNNRSCVKTRQYPIKESRLTFTGTETCQDLMMTHRLHFLNRTERGISWLLYNHASQFRHGHVPVVLWAHPDSITTRIPIVSWTHRYHLMVTAQYHVI